MEKKDVIEFFDRCAPTWDAGMIKDDKIIETILDNTEVAAGMDILDVACGTGVMFPYYLNRGVASVTGVDIAPEMAKIAAQKYATEPKVQVICADVEDYAFDRKFDRIVVYNAYYTNFEIALINTWFVAKSVYPEAFADVDMTEKTNEVTKMFLGKELAEAIFACPSSFGGYQKLDTKTFFTP